MESVQETRAVLPRTRRLGDRAGDRALRLLTAFAAGAAVLLVAAIVWKIVSGAWPAVRAFGPGFLASSDWNPVTSEFGAAQFVLGTLVTSFGALLLAAPLSIAIGLFLSELAPPRIRGPIGTLVELLAAVPSVVIGLWGIYVMGPWVGEHVEPLLARLPFVHGPAAPVGMLQAILVLAIMIVPISSSICRELFLAVPRDLQEGALALGATRWETVRGVVLAYTRGGVVAALVLGLGRALGEAIAVTQVIGNSDRLPSSLLGPADTLASRIANQYQGAVTNLQAASLVYLALILLAITLVANVAAQVIVARWDARRSGR